MLLSSSWDRIYRQNRKMRINLFGGRLVKSSRNESNFSSMCIAKIEGLDLPSTVEKLAHNFVKICEQHGVLQSKIECDIGPMWEDDIMFDWNNGSCPVLTVVISASSPKFVYSGNFGTGDFSGEEESLNFAGSLLARFAEALGIIRCQNSAMRDILLKAGSGAGKAASLGSTPQVENYSFQYSAQQMSRSPTCCEQAGTWLSKGKKTSYMVGLTQHTSSS